MNANQILQRTGGVVRTAVRVGNRLTRYTAGQVYGIFQQTTQRGRRPKAGMDDVTLTRKVESVVFRGRDVPKSGVNVNVVDGVVWLRGELKRPEQIRALEKKVRAVPEVRGVENLLHLHKTPAPTRADTPARQQRTRSSTRRPTARRPTKGRVSDDRTGATTAGEREPSPAESARSDQGREPAPLGARGDAGGSQTDVSRGEGV